MDRKPTSITNIVIGIVVTLWASSIVAGMIDHTYQIPGTVQVTMGAVAAYLFGSKVLESARGRVVSDDEHEDLASPPVAGLDDRPHRGDGSGGE